ncbi:hypothetical protein PInf_013618 [Phytophthora infestans]|nr:hypothetical protein PInf_013618 [Phytophthora infestans]
MPQPSEISQYRAIAVEKERLTEVVRSLKAQLESKEKQIRSLQESHSSSDLAPQLPVQAPPPSPSLPLSKMTLRYVFRGDLVEFHCQAEKAAVGQYRAPLLHQQLEWSNNSNNSSTKWTHFAKRFVMPYVKKTITSLNSNSNNYP